MPRDVPDIPGEHEQAPCKHRPVQDRLPPGMFAWHLDTCQGTKFGPDLRKPDDPQPTDPDEGHDGYEEGFYEIRSLVPIRAMPTLANPRVPVCR